MTTTRVAAAIAYVHAAACPGNAPGPCMNCPSPSAVTSALATLDASPRDAHGARWALHDSVCMSGCGPDSDHADRTQSKTASAIRKFRTQESAS